MKNTHTEVEKEIIAQTPPKRGRFVEAKERRIAAVDEIPPALLELRATVRRALLMIDAAIEKYLGRES